MKKLLRFDLNTRQSSQLFRHSYAGSSWRFSPWRNVWIRKWVNRNKLAFANLTIKLERHQSFFCLPFRKRRPRSSPNSVMTWSLKFRRAELVCKYCIFVSISFFLCSVFLFVSVLMILFNKKKIKIILQVLPLTIWFFTCGPLEGSVSTCICALGLEALVLDLQVTRVSMLISAECS